MLFLARPGVGAEIPSSTVLVTAGQAARADAAPLGEIDIQGQFDPSREKYQFLFNIGRLIDGARSRRDAESLSMLALLVLEAERLSGRSSPAVSGEALLAEATRLAKAQCDTSAAALAATAWEDRLLGVGNEGSARLLRRQIQSWSRGSARARQAAGRLVVVNESPHSIALYASQRYLGIVEPYDSRYVYLPCGATELFAHAACHRLDWGPVTTTLPEELTWRLVGEEPASR